MPGFSTTDYITTDIITLRDATPTNGRDLYITDVWRRSGLSFITEGDTTDGLGSNMVRTSLLFNSGP